MIIPVRCITCGRPLAGMWGKFKERVAAGEKPADVLNDLGIESYCCRSLFLTHKDKLADIAQFRA